ncbi:elongation factor P [Mycoplasma mycoides]|uniref:Elongation factor P n=3 Tax=Mycoplasma mycoides TaxID=2102 RepID=EFP_MYCMS|nr:elongation factor P [Mycoplasma mycoides]Q6MTF7.1 RecName: Full=Elongation factor P; Short=EF-P [Mycoplasma mycoides subsp. mycoides SC str. PG1]ADH21652.1 translation elongation factor P [synthetic Mycoplasma mycoides JCVI-syn1.0]AMW76473.1 efp: translation elongation factor P [synthetic bacterium JCVI-Syn3.0]AMW76935.1 efp: translation elongation factor P [synthetic bacterium JCVI-Syn2.0]AVX54759.1 Elongation factor P [synthetic bacterium JCVI-Syn3A]QWN46448.1 elongation factor P [synthe
MSVNDLRPGTTFLYDGNIYLVLEQAFSKTGRQQGKVTVKAKNMRTGARVELTFTGGEKVDKAMIERKEMQYLYNDGNDAYLMNTETYEQVSIPMTRLEWEKNFLVDGLMINMTEFENEVLGIDLPVKVELTVVEAEAAVKGDTTSGAQKKAILETGLEIMVPLFVNQGTKIIVSSADGKYVGRA